MIKPILLVYLLVIFIIPQVFVYFLPRYGYRKTWNHETTIKVTQYVNKITSRKTLQILTVRKSYQNMVVVFVALCLFFR